MNLSRFLLFIISVLLSLGMTEGFLRWYYYRWNNNLSVPLLLFYRRYPQSDDIRDFIQASPTKGIFFELKPNVRSIFLKHTFYTNSKGMIGEREYTLDKPADVFRIVGIGDSFLTSWGVNPDEACLSVLEGKLSDFIRPKKVEVLNFAVPGYNTAQEKDVLISKALAYHPDYIIIGFVGNDMDMPNYIRKKVYAKSYLYYFLKTLIGYLKIMTNNKQDDLTLSTALMGSPTASDEEFGSLYKRFVYTLEETPEEYKYMVGYDNYLRIMNEMASETVQKHIPALVIFQSVPYQDMISRISSTGYDTLNMEKEIHTYIVKNNVHYESLQIGNGDSHYNATGHRLCADLLFDHLASSSSILLEKN